MERGERWREGKDGERGKTERGERRRVGKDGEREREIDVATESERRKESSEKRGKLPENQGKRKKILKIKEIQENQNP